MMRSALTLLALLFALPATADTGCFSWTAAPAGTVMSNPESQAKCQTPHSQTYATYGHIAWIKKADMTSTADQALAMMTLSTMPIAPASYMVTAIYATNCTTTPAGATGGLYTALAKGGTAVVAAAQTYTALTTTTAIQPLTDNITTVSISAQGLYLHLDAGASAGTPKCDVYVDGIGLQ